MNFVWEMAIKLANNPEARQKLFFKQAKEYSSYYEQAFECLNETDCDKKTIELNGLYRFDNIFGELLSPRFNDYNELKTYLYDGILHFLVEVDLYHGLCKREYYSRKIRDEILKGVYGDKMARVYSSCSQKTQQSIADHLLIQYKVGSNLQVFTRVIKAIYPESITYQSTVNAKQILVYIGEKKSTTNENIVEMLIDSFLPISFNVRLFWEHHFGILDVDATLKLDQIEII